MSQNLVFPKTYIIYFTCYKHHITQQKYPKQQYTVYSIHYTVYSTTRLFFSLLVYQVVHIYTVRGKHFQRELDWIVRCSSSQGDIRIFLNSWLPSWMHPEPDSEFIHTSSVLTGSSSSFLCQVQWAWVEFTIFSSPCPKLASLKTDHAGFGLRYLNKQRSN